MVCSWMVLAGTDVTASLLNPRLRSSSPRSQWSMCMLSTLSVPRTQGCMSVLYTVSQDVLILLTSSHYTWRQYSILIIGSWGVWLCSATPSSSGCYIKLLVLYCLVCFCSHDIFMLLFSPSRYTHLIHHGGHKALTYTLNKIINAPCGTFISLRGCKIY